MDDVPMIDMQVETTKVNPKIRAMKPGCEVYIVPFSLEGLSEAERRRYDEYESASKTWIESHPAYSTDVADKFRGEGHIVADDLCRSRGYTSVKILEFLTGKPWNNLALNYVLGFSPNMIRVVSGMERCDAVPGRITVRLDSEDKIREIEMECRVGLFGCLDGHDLRLKTKDPHHQTQFLSPCYINVDSLTELLSRQVDRSHEETQDDGGSEA